MNTAGDIIELNLRIGIEIMQLPYFYSRVNTTDDGEIIRVYQFGKEGREEYRYIYTGNKEQPISTYVCPVDFKSMPRYTQSFDAAWEVIQKLWNNGNGWSWSITDEFPPQVGCEFWMGDTRCLGMATTIPLAVCKAAIKTLDSYASSATK